MKALFRLLITCIPFLTLQTSYCQTISGQITNKKHQAIESATLHVFKDTSLINTTISDSEGRYIIKGMPAGGGKILISAIGYTRQEIGHLPQQDTVINLQLTEEKSLKEIVVNSRKKLVEIEGDKLVFHVEKSIMSEGMDAYTALQNTPGITINDHEIRLVGKGSVALMINEKISHIPPDALMNYLKNLPASDIADIEIISNPSAQYEAAGNYGLVNIVMKKSALLGYNGDVYMKFKQTKFPMYKTGTSFYYTRPKTKVNAGLNWGDGSYEQCIENTIHYPSQKWESEEPERQYNRQLSGNFGLDQELSEKSNFSLDYTGFYQHPNMLQKSKLDIFNEEEKLDSSLTSSSLTKQTVNNHTVNTQFTHNFDAAGKKKMILTADYIYYSARKDMPFSSITKDADEVVISDPEHKSLSKGFQSSHIGTINAHFIFPLSNGELNYGAKLSFTENKDDVSFANWEKDAWQLDSNQTNLFYYRENTQAVFASYKHAFKKWDYQFGVRGEYTELKGGYDKTFAQLNTDYFKIFPTVYVNYKLNEDHSFSLTYGKRVDRPAYFQLNPFRWLVSEYTYVNGNPTLQPAYVHNVELSHNYAGVLHTSIFYSRENDGITQLNMVTADNQYQFIMVKNAYNKNLIGLHVFYLLDKIKNLESSIQGSLTYQESKMLVAGTVPSSEGWNYNLAIENEVFMNSSRTILGSCEFAYNSSSVENVYNLQAYSHLDVGLRFILMHEHLLLDLSGSDVFNTNIIKSRCMLNGIAQNRVFDAGEMGLNIGLRYRFGNFRLKKEEKEFGAEDERNRLK
ncbi:outer membrane beta-barrel family protein [Chitinophaga sancti]|uniref:Outer membrane receptor proteins, mostly Fe transport n=1 Tax=Chitinophaga sancti TaxID=1004 RepID=A0A1K1SLS9_9BACT|nr:outer membrane beta-barrel family protein [Chitinophaga sancti]WQD63913.1 TonB-dependent receptor [Chitinophaga sancti]WQG90462.1 TonB-dependent receptor [Chitinophaga sancti]SFW85384.1 Outer membrane receptor proteins, mostly Fe transport [Chitinophaga sancti]